MKRQIRLLRSHRRKNGQAGFTIVEAILGCAVFGILVGTMFNAFVSLQSSYRTARQLNEIYTPTLTVTNTSSLAPTDPLYSIPDSKVVSIDVGFPKPNQASPHLQLRMLITRNGVGQL
jgi:type II secretory pathway pseudopilin PulG